jgi:glycine betaine/proline transport system substrate-binding protein
LAPDGNRKQSEALSGFFPDSQTEKGGDMHKCKWTLILSLILVVALGVGAAWADDKPGKGKKVEPARATWTTGYFLAALYSEALEDLGYDVGDPKEFSNPIFYTSVVQGDVDFWANGWFPLHNAQLPKDFDEKAETAGVIVSGGAIQGYLVSKDAVEEYDIKSLDDFKRDEVKKAFDANGDGKADLVACPPGWGCEKVITHHLDVYDLEDHINPIKASYSASMADAVARAQAGEPVFFYTWTPNWTVNKFKPGQDVMWINVPEINPSDAQEGLEDAMVASGINGAVSDPIKMGFVANDIVVVANKKFLKENPAAAKFFEVASVPLADIAAQNQKMYEGEDKESDIQRHVEDWISANKDKYQGWLDQATAACK